MAPRGTSQGKNDVSPHSTVTSLSAVERAKTGENEAWRNIVVQFDPLVYKMCRKAGLSLEETQDVAQETFLAISRGLSNFRHDRPNDGFRKWICVVARNKLIDHCRKRKRQPQAAGGSTARQLFEEIRALSDCSESLSNIDDAKMQRLNRLRQALDKVRPRFAERTWQAFQLSATEQHSDDEISRRLDMSPNAVKNARYKVRKALRAELEGDLAPPAQ